jgi:hypothetical protein
MLPSEFKPSLLQAWIREAAAKGARYSNARTVTKKGVYERMRLKFLSKVSAPESQLQEWFDSLEFREKQYLPLLYENSLNQNVKSILIDEIRTHSHEDKRLFLRLIDAMYRTNDEQLFLPIIRSCYRKHEKRLIRSFGPTDQLKWEKFICDEPKKALIQKIHQSSEKFDQVVQYYRLFPNHPYYEEVVFAYFRNTDQSGFLKYIDLFINYFKNRNNMLQQKLVGYLLTKFHLKPPVNTKLHNALMDIYDAIRTHRIQPNFWTEVPESLKEKFASYFLQHTLLEFFDGLELSNRERFGYWKKFRVNMKDALVLENRNIHKIEKTIVFYFHNEVVVEILGVGAAYVYDHAKFQEKFGRLIENARNSVRWRKKTYIIPLTRSQLMFPDLVKKSHYKESDYSEIIAMNGKLIHASNWQEKFDKYFKGLGWEVDANVLAAKEKRLFDF